MKRQKRPPTPQPVELTELPAALEFITGTGEASLKERDDLPDREALTWAVRLLPYAATEALNAAKKVERERALMKALWHAFTIGSYGTTSDNTKFAGTAAGRAGRAQKRAATPYQVDLNRCLAEAMKTCKPGRGFATAFDHEVVVLMKKRGHTVSKDTAARHRKKMLTV